LNPLGQFVKAQDQPLRFLGWVKDDAQDNLIAHLPNFKDFRLFVQRGDADAIAGVERNRCLHSPSPHFAFSLSA
jgi:hypothetical protein